MSYLDIDPPEDTGRQSFLIIKVARHSYLDIDPLEDTGSKEGHKALVSPLFVTQISIRNGILEIFKGISKR